jgi:hypothetical protein
MKRTFLFFLQFLGPLTRLFSRLFAVRIAALLLPLGLGVAPAIAVYDPFANPNDNWGNDFEEAEPWKEGDWALPAWPQAPNLIEFSVDKAPARYRHYLDANSLTIGEDDYVVRYTVVIETGGARNVFYDGVRCDAHVFRNYAFGINETFTVNEKADWETVTSYGIGRFRRTLHDYFFCNGLYPYKSKQILNRLRYPPSNNSGAW